MPFVLEASISACWAFDDEDHPVAASALERMRCDETVAPGLWWLEARNILLVGERRGRLTRADTTAFLRELSRFGAAIDRAPQEIATLTFARQQQRTFYNARCLELAQREALPLAAADRALQSTAAALDIALVEATE